MCDHGDEWEFHLQTSSIFWLRHNANPQKPGVSKVRTIYASNTTFWRYHQHIRIIVYFTFIIPWSLAQAALMIHLKQDNTYVMSSRFRDKIERSYWPSQSECDEIMQNHDEKIMKRWNVHISGFSVDSALCKFLDLCINDFSNSFVQA